MGDLKKKIEDTIIEVLYPVYGDVTTRMFVDHTVTTDMKAHMVRFRYDHRDDHSDADFETVTKYKEKLNKIKGKDGSIPVFALCREIENEIIKEYKTKSMKKTVNFYSAEELGLIKQYKGEGLSAKQAFVKFDSLHPGRTLGAFTVKYYSKRSEHKKKNKSVLTPAKGKLNAYSKDELSYMKHLIDTHPSTTFKHKVKLFLEEYPERSYNGVEWKLRTIVNKGRRITGKVKFYTKKEIKLIEDLVNEGLSYTKAHKKFSKIHSGRGLYSFRQKYYSVRASMKGKTDVVNPKVRPSSTDVDLSLDEIANIKKLYLEGLSLDNAYTEHLITFPNAEFRLFKNKYNYIRRYQTSKNEVKNKIRVTPDTTLDEARKNYLLPFNNESSEVKEATRGIICDLFNRNLSYESRILSLPADNFIFEDKLMRFNPNIKLTCVEKNRNTYEKGLNKAVSRNVNYYKAECLDILKACDNSFNHMWLDFCGPYSKSVDEIIRTVAVRNLLTQDGYLAITLLGARETCDIFRNYDDNTRNIEIPRRICNTIPDLKLVNIYHYKSNGNSPMRVYIFKRTTENTQPELISLNSEKLKV